MTNSRLREVILDALRSSGPLTTPEIHDHSRIWKEAAKLEKSRGELRDCFVGLHINAALATLESVGEIRRGQDGWQS